MIRLTTMVVGLGLLSTGCYSLQPVVVVEPPSGTRLAFAINDVGRVALGGSMGPALLKVNGTLVTKQSDDYFVSVSGVDLLQGGFQTWAGETVRINSSYVSAVYERKFSKGRTILASAAIVGALAMIIRSPLGDAFLEPPGEPPDGGPVTRRGRIPVGSGLPPFLRSINPPRSH
jgi:hypothetical protein